MGFIVLAFLVGLYFYPIVPQEIPTHWNVAGQADNYSSKAFGLFFLPILIAGFYAIFTYLPFIAVYRQNLVKFSKHYFRFKTAFVGFLIALYIASIVQIFKPFPMNYFILPCLSLLFVFTSYLLKHSKRNFFIGFRTPWALSSDTVWKKTNAAAAKFFMAYAVIILFGLLSKKLAIYFLLVPLLGILYLFRYSYKEFSKEYPKGLNGKNINP